MTLQVEPAVFLAFFLASTRALAWLIMTPPFNSRMVPLPVKAGLAGALALTVAAPVAPALRTVPFDTSSLIGAVTIQVLTGLALGFMAQLLFGVIAAAGSLVDLFGGFSMSQAYDPFLNNQASVFGRLYQMLTVTLLFAIDGHLLLVRGFLTSFSAVPLQGPALNRLGALLTHDLGLFFLAAVEVAAPLLAALFLAQVVLGLLSRAAPSMNIFAISFPFTILVTIVLAGLALPVIPGTVHTLLDDVLRRWMVFR
jgi:flagellar biosynthetic protein FliR